MNARRALIILVLLAPLPLLLGPKPHIQEGEDAVLVSSRPLVLRAASNIARTLTADFLWLASAEQGEISGSGEEPLRIYQRGERIVTLDPQFFPAVNYFATYLGSVHDEVALGARFYGMAREWDRQNVMLYFYEIVLRTTYRRPLDDEVIAKLSKEAYRLAEANGYMKKKEVEAMLRGFTVFARNTRQNRQKIRDDLRWLKAKSQSEERKMRIGRLLEAIDRGR